jgi:hypothetical protein
MTALPVTRVVLYKHGVGYFEREGAVEGDAAVSLTFKQAEVSDVLKSLTVLDLDGGRVAAVSYDSTKPLDQLLAEVALSIPDRDSLLGLLPQLKGARVAVQGEWDGAPVEGVILGVDESAGKDDPEGERVPAAYLSVLTDAGEVRSVELHKTPSLKLLDPAVRRDLDHYLRTVLSAKKKDARTFTFFAQGKGRRRLRVSYVLEAPVWKATYRIIMGEENQPPLIQGWAVVDNVSDEDWEGVELALVAGLPVSFVHDLYTPRYIKRPVVAVRETTGVLPPEVEERVLLEAMYSEVMPAAAPPVAAGRQATLDRLRRGKELRGGLDVEAVASSAPAQVRERKLGDLFEYHIEHPVSIRRNQSALAPIVLRSFEGRTALLYNQRTRAENPLRCVEFKNTTGLTLEGGPVTVLEGGAYVGEAMLDTLKPDEERLIPYAVELGVHVLTNVDSHQEDVRRVVIRDRRLTTFRGLVQQTTYTLNNKSDAEQVFYLEHPRTADWKLFDTPEPREVTESYWRFRFALPAKRVTRFVVRQRMTLQHGQSFAEVRTDQLALWLEQKYVDEKTEKALRQVIEQQRRLAGLDSEIAALRKEVETIHAEQKRIRENLQALGDRAGEKQLRERFVRTLDGQEDRLGQIAAEVKERTAQRDLCQEELDRLLGGLEYETAEA